MKTTGVLFAGVAMLGMAQGALKIPGHVMDVSELAKAKEKAAEAGKALTFLYMDPGSS